MTSDWNPALPDQQVRCTDDSSRTGVTTGKTKKAGPFLMIEVRFGPTEVSFHQFEFLELVVAGENALDLARRGSYGNARDLRRLLTYQKIRGDLTSVFYSMESSNTDFYAHQFKPVLKFVESVSGRLLIADEVGLGKTIEAVYIWKELRARENASRLLIVCPSMLRDKWQRDLESKFGIDARIVKAAELYDELSKSKIKTKSKPQPFAFIASMEALRPPKSSENRQDFSPRGRLATLFEESSIENDEFGLFDLVVIDEAHYLRNPETANNRLGRLLRDSSMRLVLLTATPIQIGSENLYNLLRLLDPDSFATIIGFNDSLERNRPFTIALRSLWSNPPDYEKVASNLEKIMAYDGDGTGDAAVRRIYDRIQNGDAIEESDRVEYGRLLESRSFLSRYMTRSRKREVLKSRVERSAQALEIRFTKEQKVLYDAVSAHIRKKARGKSSIFVLAMIARQRQLASCFPAALQTWLDKDILVEFLEENLGWVLDDDTESTGSFRDAAADLESLIHKTDFPRMELEDQKYITLRKVILEQRKKDAKIKIVIFAFFRGTLTYLERRLATDGITSCLIMGDMKQSKTEILDRFKEDPSVSVLLSSEVGSEGIDLQFCHTLVNYDLPWNPMRVEQRIGRLDRLGQQAERISIINFVIVDSIEDDILYRLYERIGLFRDTIGELEEILGGTTDTLIMDFLNPELTTEERRRNADQEAFLIEQQRSQLEELEKNASNFFGFSDYLLNEIEDSRQRKRWIAADELRTFVEDFLKNDYPGCELTSCGKSPNDLGLELSDAAKNDFHAYLEREKLLGSTHIATANRKVCCRFDFRDQTSSRNHLENIDIAHPLLRWIRGTIKDHAKSMHPVSAMTIEKSDVQIGLGLYVFSVQSWLFKGIRRRHYLAYRAINVHEGTPLDAIKSEQLVVAASQFGKCWNGFADEEETASFRSIQDCEDQLNDVFGQKILDYQAENASICSQQEHTVRIFSERKRAGLQENIRKMRAGGNEKMIPAWEGQIRSEDARLKQSLQKISAHRTLIPEQTQVAIGIIRVV